MRAIVGLVAGIVTGFIIVPGTSQGNAVGIAVMIAIFFYIVSYIIGKRLAVGVAKSERRKLATNGIFPFIFLLLMFMIFVYTGLHQGLAR
jgi:protein-S-isoprenylcysteine O-methyltransferase Ste14